MARDAGERLKTLRLLMGLSQDEFSSIAGVSQPLISGIELHRRTATHEVLQQVAAATATPMSFFDVDPDDLPTDTLHFRKQARASAKEVKRVEATVREAYRVAARLLVETKVRCLAPPCAEGEIDADAIEHLAAQTRDALGIARDGVLRHVIRACERAGIPVVPLVLVDAQGEGEDIVIGHYGVSCWRGANGGPYLISYFSAGSGDRQRFTVAHELGHLVLHTARRGIPVKQAEEEAHRFAGAFLMPAEQAREAFADTFTLRTLAELKAHWGVSMSALIMRAFHVGQIDETRKSSLFRQMSTNHWRTKEPVTVHAEQPALMRAMLARRFGEPPPVRQAAEELGLHPVIMRSLAPDVQTGPPRPVVDNVVQLGDRRRSTSLKQRA